MQNSRGEHIYRVVSLFSGAMGLDVGVEQTGRFRVVACVETDHACCETIRLNQRAGRLDASLKVFEADITKLDPVEVLSSVGLRPGEVDLLVGGPPCQSFSTAGKRRTTQDPRGTLLWQFLRVVEKMKPRFFLMENVRGLLSAALRHRPIAERPENNGKELEPNERAGSVVRLFAEDLQLISGSPYHMDCFEVNAVNYGAPQLRERALFIANRYNAVVNFPNPTHGPQGEEEIVLPLFAGKDSAPQPWRTLADAISGLHEPAPVLMDFSPRKKRYLNMVPPGSNWRSLPPAIQKESMGKAWYAKGGRSGWWRRLTFDLPCPTLMTMPNHAGTALCHPTETRALTLREYACIQQFPDDWQFAGAPAQQYAQAGNAVPVRLGRVAGEVIARELDKLRGQRWRAYPDVPPGYRVIYVQSHVRTRKWFKDGQTFIWNDDDSREHPAYGALKTKRKVRALSASSRCPSA
ncbi:MAG: DNA cytosine methyltransferase [Candidatus Binataceae bacterium]